MIHLCDRYWNGFNFDFEPIFLNYLMSICINVCPLSFEDMKLC